MKNSDMGRLNSTCNAFNARTVITAPNDKAINKSLIFVVLDDSLANRGNRCNTITKTTTVNVSTIICVIAKSTAL